jgi:choline dehydrogenase-like flavoprotein
MLIDANTLAPGTSLEAGFCVIGSGMGGATLAQKLAATFRDVLIVEAGCLEKATEGEEPIVAEHVGRSFNMPLTRCFEVGGTSNQWHGVCGPLDEIDFEKREWIAGSGWPITRAQLEPYYLEAARMLGIPSIGWFASEGGVPQHLTERLDDLRSDRSVVMPKLVYVCTPPVRWKKKLKDLAQSGSLRCLLNATALELMVAPGECGPVTELVIASARGRYTIRAREFIVCCGGLETPRLLLNSRSSRPAGLGNDRDLVGRNLMDHPAGHFCKIGFHKPATAPLYSGERIDNHARLIAGLMLQPRQQREQRLPNHYVWVRPSVSAARIDDELMLSFLKVRGVRDLTLRQVRAILTDQDILYRILVHRLGMKPRYRYGDLWFMTEQLPNPNSRVRLSDTLKDRYGYPVARTDWQLSSEDLERFHAYTKVLFNAGLRSEQYKLAREDEPDVWSRNLASAAHHLGTARMASCPEEGVLDAQLRVFGVPNLYVCDGSVFPTAGSMNPSLTIMALALRLGERLAHAQAA